MKRVENPPDLPKEITLFIDADTYQNVSYQAYCIICQAYFSFSGQSNTIRNEVEAHMDSSDHLRHQTTESPPKSSW